MKRVIAISVVAVLLALALMLPSAFRSDTNIIGSDRISVLLTSSTQEVRAANGSPITRRGGVPIVSINYENGIDIVCKSPAYSFHFDRRRIERWTKNKTIEEAEQIIRDYGQANFERWTELSTIDLSDPVHEDPPVLADNERIDRRQGKDWLVSTSCYLDIHLYDMAFTEGSFITRFNSIDAGPITEEWWPK